MHIRIRNQLSAFVLLVSLTSLGVLAIVTWFNNQTLVNSLREQRLALIASLKSEQLVADIALLETAVVALASRVQILNAIKRYNTGNNTYANWNSSLTDYAFVLSTQLALEHITVWSPTFNETYLNVTSLDVVPPSTPGLQELDDATNTLIGYNSLEGHPGFPDELFPTMPPTGNLFLGPVQSLSNSTSHIASITSPIYNNTTNAIVDRTILGYVTVVISIFSIENSVYDSEGLGETGTYLLIRPNTTNLAPSNYGWPGNVAWNYVLTPNISRTGEGNLGGFLPNIASTSNNKGSVIDTKNPATGERVAVGFAPVNYDIVTWFLIVQQSHAEVQQPITHLRNLLLATVFGTAAGVVLLTCIIATYAVRPLGRLRDATEKTIKPPGYSPTAYESDGDEPPNVYDLAGESTTDGSVTRRRPWWKRGMASEKVAHRHHRDREEQQGFRVPEKVPDRKHFITDELTDLTTTFNEMTEELVKQYTHLEERVATRTVELKEQTELANAANDAKSMFIANVTHELRTPLNGILGMCSVIMTEQNLAPGVRRSLGTIYKSGELLLCLLTDLLTFSRNQVAGANVVLEEGEFKVKDLITQVRAIFTKTARDKGVELGIELVRDNGVVEAGEPSVKGVLRGDLNRVLQVIINLLSNALKFTPEKGSVQLRIAMLKDTNGIVLNGDEAPQKENFSLKMPQTAILNPNTPANLALKAKKEAASLTIASTTAPGVISSSSTTAYFDGGNQQEEDFLDDGEERPKIEDPRVVTKWFEFSVIDTGPGIPDHMHSKIFEPFVQGDLGLSKKYGGTGLGLSICKQLAELMGGVIELKSFEGAGSTFTLRIPLKAGGLPSQPLPGYSRPGSLATTRYTRGLPPNLRPRTDFDNISDRSAASTAFSTLSAAPQADATRLVGLSQPFFAPELPDDEDFAPEQRNSRNMEKRHSRVEVSPPPPPLPTIPSMDASSSINGFGDRNEIILTERRPALDRTSSSPVMLTPRSMETNPLGTPKLPEGHRKGPRSITLPTATPMTPTAGTPGNLPVISAPSTPKPALSSRQPGATLSPGKSVRMAKMPEAAEGTTSVADKKAAKKEAKKEAKDQKDQKPSIRVLVAEDNKVNIQVIKKMLKIEAVTDVTMAEDGQIAVRKVTEALAEGKKFDIIFMDIQMPNMDGLQATKAIREMGYLSAICALTAFAEQSNVKECFDVGMDYFLAKPIKKAELKKVLQMYGQSSAIIDASSVDAV